jgi:alpha-L-fucosidase
MATKWYEQAFRRAVIDMHITDDDERFMSRFDAGTYVEMLKLARARSAVVYAHSHVGLCYFPTKVGRMHAGLRGRDILREVIDHCRENGIYVDVYLSAIFDTWAYRQHPDWRIIDAHGNEAAAHSRYGICCPNSPYRKYIAALAGTHSRASAST